MSSHAFVSDIVIKSWMAMSGRGVNGSQKRCNTTLLTGNESLKDLERLESMGGELGLFVSSGSMSTS